MTVQELKEALNGLPDDAIVMIKHQLIGDQHCLESITYSNKKNGVVWLCEIKEV